MKRKHCPHCKENKDIDEFGKNKSRYDNVQAICKICRKIYMEKHYQNNKQKYFERNAKYDEKYNKIINDYISEKQKNGCKACGEKRKPVLDFHHLNKNDKIMSICELRKHGYALKTVINEIEKCKVLCSNCHRMLHYEERISKTL